jgi:glycosyltransferase involved in cell wall biosynthesis
VIKWYVVTQNLQSDGGPHQDERVVVISIIMPVWNGARFMDKAIASVVAQTQSEWELLIVDDGSTDDSVARADRWQKLMNNHYGEEKIRFFSTGRPNSGPSVGRNLAAEYARYDLFAYLDVDDLFFPRRIESLLPLLEKYDMVFAPYEILENERLTLWNPEALWQRKSYICSVYSSEGDREPRFDAWVRSFLQRVNLSVPLGVANRRKIYEEAGGFQPGILVGADGILWRRMADRGARIGFCPIIAGRYYVRTDSQARKPRPYAAGSHQLQKEHPLGSNGQYLDAEWFAALERKRKGL